jgi:predicted type IV restriction endonuclease
MAKLADILETWDLVCRRMDKYGTPILGANEEATRYALIDPILEALGWEIHDPKHVRVECSQDHGGKPDYTLLKKGKPVCYVEAKKWGTISPIKKLANPLASGKFDQLTHYCLSNSVAIGAFSDGGAWYLIDYSRKTAKVIAFVDAENATETDIKKLLRISR